MDPRKIEPRLVARLHEGLELPSLRVLVEFLYHGRPDSRQPLKLLGVGDRRCSS